MSVKRLFFRQDLLCSPKSQDLGPNCTADELDSVKMSPKYLHNTRVRQGCWPLCIVPWLWRPEGGQSSKLYHIQLFRETTSFLAVFAGAQRNIPTMLLLIKLSGAKNARWTLVAAATARGRAGMMGFPAERPVEPDPPGFGQLGRDPRRLGTFATAAGPAGKAGPTR